MRVSSVLSSLTALALVCVANAEGASDVLDLTPANFKSIVDAEPLMLVEFFAPWYVRSSRSQQPSSYAFIVGVATAKLLLPSTRLLPQNSRTRTSRSPRSTASTRPTCAKSTVSRDTREFTLSQLWASLLILHVVPCASSGTASLRTILAPVRLTESFRTCTSGCDFQTALCTRN